MSYLVGIASNHVHIRSQIAELFVLLLRHHVPSAQNVLNLVRHLACVSTITVSASEEAPWTEFGTRTSIFWNFSGISAARCGMWLSPTTSTSCHTRPHKSEPNRDRMQSRRKTSPKPAAMTI